MYKSLWKRLPGPFWVKSVQIVALAFICIFFLFEFIFPWFAQTFLLEESTVASHPNKTVITVNSENYPRSLA
jgi:hypothetical protein